MAMKTEMADRRLRVRSENSARISAKDLLFAFVGQNKYDYWSNILRINYSYVESQEFNLKLLVRDHSVLVYNENNDRPTLPHHRQL